MPGTALNAAAVPSLAAAASLVIFADGKPRGVTAAETKLGSSLVYLLLRILLKTKRLLAYTGKSRYARSRESSV
jgi:hypothetical protein